MGSIKLELIAGDALSQSADVLVLKYAQGLFGLDEIVVNSLRVCGERVNLPAPWDTCLLGLTPVVAAPNVLIVGVPPLGDFNYKEVRLFARKALATLAEKLPGARRVLMTIHGAGYGLDEAESFGAEIAGLADAIHAGEYPKSLQAIVIAENDRRRAARLEKHLDKLLPGRAFSAHDGSEAANDTAAGNKLAAAGRASEAKAHVFVAMPFKEEMDDIFHYGIYSAVSAAGYVCERADLSVFTGDILDRVKARIRTASLVVADLTDANPNVYLEVGYAWGLGIPTVLVAQRKDDLQFDVRGQRCLIYRKIRELEAALTSELIALRSNG